MAYEEGVFRSSMGALWVQPDGPNTSMFYLGCHDLDDIEASRGGMNLIQCFDAFGVRQTVSYTQDAEDPISTGITTYIGRTADYLESITNCPATIFALLVCEGRKDNFINWHKGVVLRNVVITSETLSGLVMRSDDNPSEQSFAIEALPPLIRVAGWNGLRTAIAETNDLLFIAILDEYNCQNLCGPRLDQGQYMITGGGVDAGSAADVADIWYSQNSGSTWAAAAAQPFGASEAASSGLLFRVDKGTYRLLVARGTTDAGNPAEIAYSDDWGATWTNVDVGSSNGEFVVDDGAMFMINQYNIWLATSVGRIYKSSDAGATWVTQEDAVLTAAPYRNISFVNELVGMAVGSADQVSVTVNGGTTWGDATTDPGSGAILVGLSMLDTQRAWVGSSNGHLYYTNDFGDTWTERSLAPSGAGSINHVVFANEMVGFLNHNTAAPVGQVYFTINGGFTWQKLETPTNAGINSLRNIGTNELWAVGAVSGGTAFMMNANTV